MSDYDTRLDPRDFEALKPRAIAFIQSHIKKDSDWDRCYSLKNRFTREIGYCYQADFYEYLKLAGIQVKIDKTGDHWAKASYRKRPLPTNGDKNSFTAWLDQQIKRNDPIGDLATDSQRDPSFPLSGNRDTYEGYLKGKGAHRDSLNAFKLAWSEYQSN